MGQYLRKMRKRSNGKSTIKPHDYSASSEIYVLLLVSKLAQRRVAKAQTKLHKNAVLSELSLLPVAIKKLNYSKTWVKRPLKNRQNKDLNDKW